jgi:hypothetical protein
MSGVSIPASIFIFGASITGIAFAVYLWIWVSKISVAGGSSDGGARDYLLEENRGDDEVRYPPLPPRLEFVDCCGFVEAPAAAGQP